jgi:hypothetical protein
MPFLDLNNVNWSPSPRKIEFGADMLIADIAITKNETLTIFTTKEGVDILKTSKTDIHSELVDWALPLTKLNETIKEIEALCLARNLTGAKKLVETIPLMIVELNQSIYTMIETEIALEKKIADYKGVKK